MGLSIGRDSGKMMIRREALLIKSVPLEILG